MPLIEDLPEPLAAVLAREAPRADWVAAVATDLNLRGAFAPEWLVLTPTRLHVYENSGASATGGAVPTKALDATPVRTGDQGSTSAPWRKRLELPLDSIKSAIAEGLVGGGSLQVCVDGKTVELVRYTNVHQRKFGRLARYLNDCRKHAEARAKGETPKDPPVLEPDPEDQRRCPQCRERLPEATKVCPACLNKGKVVRRLLKYLQPHRKQVFLIWALVLVGIGFSLVPPYLTRPLMDQVLVPRDATRSVDERLVLLGWLLLIWLGVQFIGQALGIWRGRLAVALGTRVSHDLRTLLFGHLQRLSLKFFDKRQTGALLTRVTQDTSSLESVLVDGVQHFLGNILLFLGIGTVLLCMNWKLTLLVFLPAPLVVLLSHFFWQRILSLLRRSWHLRSRVGATVNDVLSGVRVVRAFAAEDRELARFTTRSADLFRAECAVEQTFFTIFPMLFFIISTGNLIVWYVGGRWIIGEEFTLGTLTAFVAYLGMFYHPLQWITRVADYLSRSLASAERVFEILDTEPDVPDAPDAVPARQLAGAVEFQDVTFGYEKHKPALKGVSFSVRPGEMIGLVGHSGAGKSTTINLLCRFYDPQEGRVLMDGLDLRKIRQQDLRAQLGVVLQDTFLFCGTIAENVAYAKPGATREEVIAAARTANAHDFIVKKPDGYDTQVGERGQALSAGERQRIAIARAILHNPRVLILDEATSSVDAETEKQIQEALARLIHGRTTFAIAHRLSTLRNADRLLVLKDGQLVESGTHEELMAKKGEFHRLVQMQQEMSRIIEVVG